MSKYVSVVRRGAGIDTTHGPVTSLSAISCPTGFSPHVPKKSWHISSSDVVSSEVSVDLESSAFFSSRLGVSELKNKCIYVTSNRFNFNIETCTALKCFGPPMYLKLELVAGFADEDEPDGVQRCCLWAKNTWLCSSIDSLRGSSWNFGVSSLPTKYL